jgi:N-acetylneuraminate synthase/N,N'-diacetyllegionaminate synthase
MRIGGRAIGSDLPPLVIAELGVNHDGSLDTARRLIAAAAEAGAGAVKLQMFDADLLLARAAPLARYQRRAGADDSRTMLRRLQLSPRDMGALVDDAWAAGLAAIVTVFCLDLVRVAAAQPWDAFKVASPDLVNRPLIDALCRDERPILLSTGAAHPAEVETALGWMGDHPHVLMQCVSCYPAPRDLASIGGLHALRALAGGPAERLLGYSDHTTEHDTGALAVAAGACVLEKHLTHDRSARGPDHAASLDPAGLADYVGQVNRAWSMVGPPAKRVLPEEMDVRFVARQSLVAARDLPAGHRLAAQDIAIKRPAAGLAPAELESAIGRRLKSAVAADTPIRDADLA